MSQSAYEQIGDRIHLARELLGWSQTELGERLGISHVSVSNIERGKTRLELDRLAEIAAVLRQPLAYFLSGPTAFPAPPREADLERACSWILELSLRLGAKLSTAHRLAAAFAEGMERDTGLGLGREGGAGGAGGGEGGAGGGRNQDRDGP
jgi:transcriptional regulator with XRE-family HTH domain